MFDYDKLNLTVGGTARSGGVTFTGAANSSHVVDGEYILFSRCSALLLTLILIES